MIKSITCLLSSIIIIFLLAGISSYLFLNAPFIVLFLKRNDNEIINNYIAFLWGEHKELSTGRELLP
jgi:hypothetical protein